MTKMRKAIFLWVIVILSTATSLIGCGLKHVDELLVLKQYGDEADALDELVDVYEAQFEVLRDDVDQGKLPVGTDQSSIRERYGEPTYVQPSERPQEASVMWMYRRPVHYFESDQILLYFNREGKLVSHQVQRKQTDSDDAQLDRGNRTY